ncbi:hypothetical protein [Paeniglutamicibacter gangotriensis]|uniref:Uncharacterized protein n=1 Tax=Paeniglutamicibacter gangotriensis Lz1y TaxID=1276920 RepID=M7NDD8_9MICC|nr:hypothetical protein [Paeniglutamicibacter gangotriensis]EMQ99814.1 hypothetical protein ADIAG_00917 [Paeniglutamicibacter gangotriensis Lz1y]
MSTTPRNPEPKRDDQFTSRDAAAGAVFSAAESFDYTGKPGDFDPFQDAELIFTQAPEAAGSDAEAGSSRSPAQRGPCSDGG